MADLNLAIRDDAVHVTEVIIHLTSFAVLEVDLLFSGKHSLPRTVEGALIDGITTQFIDGSGAEKSDLREVDNVESGA